MNQHTNGKILAFFQENSNDMKNLDFFKRMKETLDKDVSISVRKFEDTKRSMYEIQTFGVYKDYLMTANILLQHDRNGLYVSRSTLNSSVDCELSKGHSDILDKFKETIVDADISILNPKIFNPSIKDISSVPNSDILNNISKLDKNICLISTFEKIYTQNNSGVTKEITGEAVNLFTEIKPDLLVSQINYRGDKSPLPKNIPDANIAYMEGQERVIFKKDDKNTVLEYGDFKPDIFYPLADKYIIGPSMSKHIDKVLPLLPDLKNVTLYIDESDITKLKGHESKISTLFIDQRAGRCDEKDFYHAMKTFENTDIILIGKDRLTYTRKGEPNVREVDPNFIRKIKIPESYNNDGTKQDINGLKLYVDLVNTRRDGSKNFDESINLAIKNNFKREQDHQR